MLKTINISHKTIIRTAKLHKGATLTNMVITTRQTDRQTHKYRLLD